jgi:hypothetical protein
LESIQPHPIKVMDPVPINIRADEKAIEDAKTGKVTMVVAIMHIFGETKCNSPNAKAKISAKKAKLGPKSKKIGINQLETHLEEVQQPPNNASKRLLAKSRLSGSSLILG